ncbi:hypothetical protein [Clostridium perfringens]|uniref:hypothetical protein n=1 Tax=Clostridium perfringens TaxID=1502 RepID=UPI00156F6C7B|nr:hypothetical protein [Clostridium perfringens]MDU7143158.1 hypothetical protein [Anaerococcus vaginalis]MDU7943370.1 hypothetical protein [Streptococcus salivarius]MDU7977658.1 hypothetical protein [Clostridioides difficile]MBI6024496.1 hypothetical protein [Clostridium perfringens]MBI6048517.1 hypothetical protein [Clostridium perfringens]
MYKYLISEELDFVIEEKKFKKQVLGDVYTSLRSKFKLLKLNLKVFQEITIDELDKLLIKSLKEATSFKKESIFYYVDLKECLENRNIILLLTYSKVLSIRFEIISDSKLKLTSITIF